MKCPKCQTENPDGAQFCGVCRCSLKTEIICPHCGHTNPSAFKFCNKCGRSLAEQTSAQSPPATPSPPVASAAPLPVPAAFASGRYQVKEFLGKGSRENVSLAYDTILDRIDSSSHLICMTSVDLILEMGNALGLDATSRVLDLCCGYGEMLRLLAQYYGSHGTGVEISEEFTLEGRKRIERSGLSGKVRLECHDARTWPASGFDVACLVGEQGVFGGFRNTMAALFDKVHARGKVVIGTPYFTHDKVPQELIDFEGTLETEKEIFEQVKGNGCIVTFIGRGTCTDWDRYISWSTRRNLAAYRKESDSQEKRKRYDWMHRWHEVYLNLRMEHEGWAIYTIERM